MQFEFSTPQRIIFGSGTFEQVKALAKPMGKKAMVVTGKGGAKPEKLFNLLEESGIAWQRVIIAGEPTIDLIRSAVEAARTGGCELIIAFGGGSVLDSGKAIAAMMANPGDLMDYLEIVGKGQPILNRSAPYIAIPTTAGTGSEVTKNAVLLVPEKKLKK
jgi:alcohol dehydrogenase class IV